MASPILTDNFEAYSTGNLNGQGSWAGSTAFQVETGTVESGTKAVSLTNPGSNTQIFGLGVKQNSGNQGIWVRTTSTTQEFDVVLVDSTASNDVCMKVTFNSTGNGQAAWVPGGGGETQFSTITADTWYQLIFEWSSVDSKYKVTFNGVTTSFALGVSSTPQVADTVLLQGRGTGTYYWDNFALGSTNLSLTIPTGSVNLLATPVSEQISSSFTIPTANLNILAPSLAENESKNLTIPTANIVIEAPNHIYESILTQNYYGTDY